MLLKPTFSFASRFCKNGFFICWGLSLAHPSQADHLSHHGNRCQISFAAQVLAVENAEKSCRGYGKYLQKWVSWFMILILILIGMIVCDISGENASTFVQLKIKLDKKEPRFAEANFQEANWSSWEMYLLDTDLNSLQNRSPVFFFRVFVKERNT